MDFEFIKRVVQLVEEAEITELEVESDEGLRVVVKKGGGYALPAHVHQPVQQVSMPAPQAAAPETAKPGGEDDGLKTITSPMVGTFYRAPAPDAPNFVEVGSEVKPDTVVCILEAMKVMNEIKAGVSGIVRSIQAENGEPVEYDQPLFKIEAK